MWKRDLQEHCWLLQLPLLPWLCDDVQRRLHGWAMWAGRQASGYPTESESVSWRHPSEIKDLAPGFPSEKQPQGIENESITKLPTLQFSGARGPSLELTFSLMRGRRTVERGRWTVNQHLGCCGVGIFVQWLKAWTPRSSGLSSNPSFATWQLCDPR